MAAPLALEAAPDTRPRNVVTMGVAVAYSAGLMTVGGLVATWIQVQKTAGASNWPPDAVEHIDNYPGSMLAATAVLLAALAAWATHALRSDDRRQAQVGSALTLLVGLAFLNAIWYVGATIGHGPGENAYALLVHAFVVVVGVLTVASLALNVATLLRIAGGQVSAQQPEMAVAAAWAWYFTTAAWMIAFFTVYVPDLLFK